MYKKSKVLNWQGERVLLEVEGVLKLLGGNKSPYFSVTGSYWKANKKGKKDARYSDCIGCGCCHDIILKAFPDMKDFIALHLASDKGKPMSAVENGFYWLKEKGVQACADYLRIPVSMITPQVTCDKKVFADFIDTLCLQWQAEANAVIEKYHLEVEKC